MHVDTQLLALLCAHFLGDFVFQTDRLVVLKKRNFLWLVIHVLIVSLLTWLLLGNLAAWWIAATLFFLHLAVDCTKIFLEQRANSRQKSDKDATQIFHRFLADQTLHILTIILLYLTLSSYLQISYTNHWQSLLGLQYSKGLLLLTGLALGVSGVGITLKYQMAEFAIGLEEKVKQGLPKGGKAIGILERLLIFMFVLAGKPEGAGFVIAAKSVFRIGELTNKEEKDHAEYIMIGTLRSFTYALGIAFCTSWLLNHIK